MSCISCLSLDTKSFEALVLNQTAIAAKTTSRRNTATVWNLRLRGSSQPGLR
jgi:hypothetical protein